jgi:hypothetical protein
MYILFKAVSERQLGIVQTIGRTLTYAVGYLPDTHTDIAEFAHLKPKVLSENVALAWKFFGAYKNSISVKAGTPQNEQLQLLNSSEPTGEKVKYYFTEEDIANTVEFMRAVMLYMIDEVYDKRFVQANLPPSELEGATWPQQKAEALAYTADPSASVPMLTSLAAARGITVAEMVAKVNTAVANYNATIASLLATKQARQQEVKACASIADCNRFLHRRFDLHMPTAQMEDENIVNEPTVFDI